MLRARARRGPPTRASTSRWPPTPALRPQPSQADALGLTDRARAARGTECPRTVACEWVPAPYEEYRADGDYGNHDKARPARGPRRSTTSSSTTPRASWDTTLKLVQDPTYVSWNYTLRSSDGHIAQHVPHQGRRPGTRATGTSTPSRSASSTRASSPHPDAWYTEAMYRALGAAGAVPGGASTTSRWTGSTSSATTTCRARPPANIPGMHTDPGPYWDWAHYFDAAGRAVHAPPRAPDGGLVTIARTTTRNQPVYTGCDTAGDPCPAHGSTAVRLHTAPSEDAPLVKDIGLHPDGGASHDGRQRHRRPGLDRPAVRGGRPAGRLDGDLVPRPEGVVPQPARPADRGATPGRLVVTPKAGPAEIPVYGRAYPEEAAYPAGVPVQAVSPAAVHARRPASGTWSGPKARGEYFYATTFDPDARATRWCGASRRLLRDPARPAGRLRQRGRRAGGQLLERPDGEPGHDGRAAAPGGAAAPRRRMPPGAASGRTAPGRQPLLEHLRGQRLEQGVEVVGDGPVPAGDGDQHAVAAVELRAGDAAPRST